MTLHGYLQVLRERWKLIVVTLLIGAAGAAALTVTATKMYASSVTMFVSAQDGQDLSATNAYQGNLLSQQRVKSYVELLQSRRLAQQVVSATKVPITPAALAGEISAASQPDTVLLSATITDRSPQQAERLANSVGDQFGKLVSVLEAPPTGGKASVAVRVVQPATFSATPVSPRPVRNVGLGALLGVLVGLAGAFTRNALDTSVKSVAEMAEITGSPSLGVIAYDSEVHKRPLIVQAHPHAPRAEAFRQLRTGLHFIDIDRPRKVVVVTSSVPEEGKTTTLCNLAIALAQGGSRVVLVESDLRRPRAAQYLGIEGAVGLTSVLAGKASLDETLQPWGDDLLTVLASGPLPPNPSELLASEHMRAVLAELSERFEIVLLDSPPLLPVTDAAALAAQCDGALIVVRHGRTSRAQVSSSTAALTGVGARVLGSVLTMAPAASAGSYYYYYATESKNARHGRRSRRTTEDAPPVRPALPADDATPSGHSPDHAAAAPYNGVAAGSHDPSRLTGGDYRGSDAAR